MTRLVSTKSLSCVCPLQARPDVAFPPVGRLGLSSPPSTVLCDATTATCPSRGPSLVARSPIPCVLPSVCGLPGGLVCWSKRPDHARAFGHPVPQSGNSVKEPGGSPKFPRSPWKTCPALRPRWCPAHSPSRTQDYCLPATGNRRRSSLYLLRLYPFRGSITRPASSLHPARTSIAGWHAGSLLTGWLDVRQVGLEPFLVLTHWETTTNFMGLHPLPRFRAYLGATSAMLGQV